MTRNIAVLYARVSTEEQLKGTSLDDQFAGNNAKAKAIGAEVGATFEDSDRGEFYLTRKGLQDALASLESGKANILIAKDLVRLTRNDRAEQSAIFERIQRAGARLVFWDVEYDNSPMGQFSQNVTGDFAILEKQVIKDRTMRGRRRRAMEGQMPCRAWAPYGYYLPKHEDIIKGLYPADQVGKYQLDPERAPIARQVFERYARGESLHAICNWLMAERVPMVNGGAGWAPVGISTMLDNPAYYGLAAFGRKRTITDESRRLRGLKTREYSVPVPEKDWIRIPCPAIVSKELWDQCQINRKENRAKLSTRSYNRQMLTGMLRCPFCNRVMNGREKRHNSVKHYHCKESGASLAVSGIPCWKKHLNGERMEALVRDVIKAVLGRPEVIEEAYQSYYAALHSDLSEQQHTRLKAELADIHREETNVVKAQIQGVAAGANTAIYESMLRDLSLRRTAIQTKLDEYQKARQSALKVSDRAELVAAAVADIQEAINAPEGDILPSEKNTLLRKVVKNIRPEVEDYGVTVTFRSADETTELVVSLKEGGEPSFAVIAQQV